MEETAIEKHLALLADAFYENLRIDNCEFGGIGLDCKRPFGNSNVEYDILEIIGIDPTIENEEEWEAYARYLYFKKLVPYLKDRYAQSKLSQNT